MRWVVDANMRKSPPVFGDVPVEEDRFAVGVIQQDTDVPATYELFRPYRVPDEAKKSALPGPSLYGCGLSEVLGATGAARFFLEPYKLGDKAFSDEMFPCSHPISSLALDEVIALYGKDVQISLILNIGPGIPDVDALQEIETSAGTPLTRLARKLSWHAGKRRPARRKTLQKEAQDTTDQPGDMTESVAVELEDRKQAIKNKLVQMYGPSAGDRYHHLGPARSAEWTGLNDVVNICGPQEESDQFREQQVAEAEAFVKRAWVDVVV
jgi:hypothetical protein